MQVKVTTNGLTISVNESNSITTIATGSGFEFFQSVEKGNKITLDVQNEIKQIVLKKIDNKNNYNRRLKIVAAAIQEANTQTFRGILNILRKKF